MVDRLHSRAELDVTDHRTIGGLVVRYNVELDGGEMFGSGAFAATIDRGRWHKIPLVVDGHRVGTLTGLADRHVGLWAEWRIADTPAGDRLLDQAHAGTLAEVTIGFVERISHDDHGRRVHTSVRLRDVTLVSSNVVLASPR